MFHSSPLMQCFITFHATKTTRNTRVTATFVELFEMTRNGNTKQCINGSNYTTPPRQVSTEFTAAVQFDAYDFLSFLLTSKYDESAYTDNIFWWSTRMPVDAAISTQFLQLGIGTPCR